MPASSAINIQQSTDRDVLIPSTYLPFARRETKAAYLRLPIGVKKILRKRKQIAVSDWCERHRVVTMSSVTGPWKNRVTPYLAGIMDASFYPSVEEIDICAAPQTGKSECINNCIGYCIDRRPGSVLYVYPDEMTARENSQDRIIPMITSSRRLCTYLTGYVTDTNSLRINLQHMQIYMGWARSAARLANKPLPYLVLDEVDKYPETAGKKEAGPIPLAEKRTRTYRGYRKIWKASTPTIESGPIWQALANADVVFDYWVKCPECGAWQIMIFENIRWPKDCRDPNVMEAQDLARYLCPKCEARWDDQVRDQAVRTGDWRSRPVDDKDRPLSMTTFLRSRKPKKIAFHIPSWISHFVGLSEVAARFLKGLGDKTLLRDFQNNDRAEPWVAYSKERKEDRILALRDDRPRGRVPGSGKVAALIGTVDTQDYGFWYEIRAWGYGLEKESWQIREGYVTTFDAVAEVMWRSEYRDNDGLSYVVNLVLQDALGHRTSEVYDFCRKYRSRIIPIFGRQTMANPYTWTNIEYYPGTKKVIPGGLRALNINSQFYKDDLSGILEIAPSDPGAWHFHSETTFEWAQHLTAEYRDEKNIWQCPSGKANHGWDCSYLQLAGHDILGVRYWKRPDQAQAAARKKKRSVPAAGARGRW